MYLHTELLNSWISSLSLAHQLSPPRGDEQSRSPPTTTSAYLVLSFLVCCVRRRERKKRLSAKQQDGRAMATLDRQIPSLDTFLCEPWSSFVSAAKLRLVDSKFARRYRCCFCGQTVRKCVVQLSVIELSKPLHHAASVKAQQSNCQKYYYGCNNEKVVLTAVRRRTSKANGYSVEFVPLARAVIISSTVQL